MTIHIEKDSFNQRWSIFKGNGRGGEIYLHKDGTWHDGTSDNCGNFPGLFATETAAQEALALAIPEVLAPIRLTSSNYWQELENLRVSIDMPASLVDCLKEIVSSHLNTTIGPEATSSLKVSAAFWLKAGILLSDSAGDYLYDIMVWVPNRDHKELMRSFFRLIPKWPGGQLKYLGEI